MGQAPMGQPGGSPLDSFMPAPMSEAEMDADLQDRFDKVSRKKAELDTRKITDKNKLEKMKSEILGKFFDAMIKLGVDPSDPASISKFIQELEQTDPDFVALLETAFNVLAPMPQAQAPSGRGLMDQFGGLQEGVLRGVVGGMEPEIGIGMGAEGMESMQPEAGVEPAAPLPEEMPL